jgi:hypothetical protein
LYRTPYMCVNDGWFGSGNKFSYTQVFSDLHYAWWNGLIFCNSLKIRCIRLYKRIYSTIENLYTWSLKTYKNWRKNPLRCAKRLWPSEGSLVSRPPLNRQKIKFQCSQDNLIWRGGSMLSFKYATICHRIHLMISHFHHPI